jgi:hypothetical protein
MSALKSLQIVAYVATLGGFVIFPFLQKRGHDPRFATATLTYAFGFLAALSCFVLLARIGSRPLPTLLLLGLLLLLPVVSQKGERVRPAVGGALALPFLWTLTWWFPAKTGLTPWAGAAFVIIALLLGALTVLYRKQKGLPRFSPIALLTVVAAGGALVTGQFEDPVLLVSLWHHWGAYVMPAQVMSEGGVPFRDVPLQYGVGPTLLLMGLCKSDCWPGMYVAVSVANAVHLLAMGACACLLTRALPRGVAWGGLLAVICAVVMWTGFPPNYSGPLLAPSTGGLRFLPLALLLLHVVHAETNGRDEDRRGHTIWAFGILWSPEACLHASMVWWPYLALRDWHRSTVDGSRTIVSVLAMRAAQGVAASLLVLGLAALVFRFVYEVWPSLDGYLTYLQNPPGTQNPKLKGPIWWLIVPVLIGCAALPQMEEARRRVVFVCTLALIAASTYYLGRSHDNNVLNLLPFVAISLLASLQPATPLIVKGFIRVALAGFVSWVAIFNFASFNNAVSVNLARMFGPTTILDGISLSNDAAADKLTRALPAGAAPVSDLRDALDWIRSVRGGQPVVSNLGMILPRGDFGPVWTGLGALTNFHLLPEPIIIRFVRQGAKKFRRAGWILVDTTERDMLLPRFRSAYDVAEERAFGQYKAYRLVPRRDFERAER